MKRIAITTLALALTVIGLFQLNEYKIRQEKIKQVNIDLYTLQDEALERDIKRIQDNQNEVLKRYDEMQITLDSLDRVIK